MFVKTPTIQEKFLLFEDQFSTTSSTVYQDFHIFNFFEGLVKSSNKPIRSTLSEYQTLTD